ncbi:hypothetical protein [Mucilaginibacter flavidus]|uniref:hypothetical protein n=1 Tax=Mucilaginibacter flavidus TaxID=2949309 RepID=UPI0020927462|nr:hypothetical protein [Mucilaginibacter flavidus]
MSSTTTTYSQSNKISRKRGIIKQAAALLRSFGHNLISKLKNQFASLNNIYQNTPKLPVRTLSYSTGSVLFLP